MNQSMPWMKLPHRQYMISISRAALKPIERLAFLELAMYANTQPNRQLPDIDDALAGWTGLSLSQWTKIKGRVLAEWTLTGGAWSLPEWFDLYSDDQANHAPTTPQPTNTDSLSSKRRAAAKARWDAKRAKPDANVMQTDANSDAKPMKTPILHDAKPMQADANSDFAYANEGGKGGDLDQDLDLKESVCVTPCAATVSNTDPLSFTRHTLSQTGFTVLEIPKQFASLAMQRNSQLTDADLNVIWSRLLDWASTDHQINKTRNWFNTWIARVNSDAAVTITNRLKHQDTPANTATVVEAACYRTIRPPVTTSPDQTLTDEQLAEMQRNKSALLAQLTEDVA